MHFNRLAQQLRIPAIALFSILLASCGSGSGKDSVDADADDVTTSKLSLVFRDDFGGAPVGARTAARIPPAPLAIGNWVVDTGYGSNGWGNDEWQRYDNSMDNLFTEDGSLVIRAKCTAPVCGKRDGTITSAKITTKDRLNVRYGTIRARIKMPSGLGMWPAFWTLGSDIDDRPWPDAGELDIVEMHYFYSDTRTTHFSTHWSGPRFAPENRPDCWAGVGSFLDPAEEENCKTDSKTFDEPGDVPLTDDFHVYEMEWNENSIRGKIDGITYFTQAIDGATMEEFLKDHYLILNVAVGGTLGGPFGPAMSAADWADPDQTDMLVDWVEVYEKVPPTQATLIDESGNNLDYGRIINSAEVGGAFVESDEDSTAVTPLVGSQVLELIYSTSVSENGGVPASFSGAFFDFNSIDLSAFTKLVFSIDTSQFPGFDHIGIQFEDSHNGFVLVWTEDYTPTAITGSWETYEIPLSDFAGVDLGDVVIIGFSNPHDSSHTLIAGTLFIDDIRFETEECTAVGSVAFDSINYNPSTPVAAVSVNDACAASSLVTVKVENGIDEIVVGVKLDAAGNGETVFNLLADNSVCSSDDSGALMKLSAPLMATYTRTYIDAGGTQQFNTATATAGIDPAAPGTSITGAKSYFYTSDPGQALSFLPDVDFNYSIFGSGSVLNGAFSDSTFDPVFAVTSGPDYGAEVAQIAMINLPAGFSAGKEAINFKIKNQPNNLIKVEFGVLGGAADARVVDLLDTSVSTSIGDGWYSVSIPMTDFPNAGVNDFLAITSGDPAPPSGSTFTYLITDIFLQEAVGGAPAECANVVQPPVTGSGTGATGATGGPFSVSFDDSAVTYGFTGFGNPDTITALGADPEDSSNMVAVTTKPVNAQVWAGVTVEPVPGITYPLTATESQMTIRIYAPGAGVTVRMKMEESGNASNSVETEAVTTVDTGWETLTFDFNNQVAGTTALNPAFNYDKLSLFFGFGSVGDGTVYTWDSIEFLGGGGGGATVTVPVDFEDAGGPYTFNDFGGGVATVIDNVQPTGNASAKVGQMQKFAGDVFGGSTLTLDAAVDFTAGEVFTMKVFSQKVSALTFKLEGLNVEEVVNTTGAGWETLSFDFTGRTTGAAVMGITLIFDNGTAGDALNDPTNWTFLFDDIELTAGGGGGGGGAAADIDFETGATGAAFTWNVFENVDNPALVIGANPDATGINTSTTVAQFTARQAGQPFAGVITNDLPTFTLDATNSVVKIMVYKSVISDVGIKFENGIGGSTGDIKVANTLINTWEELTFDFSAVIGDPNNTDITGFIVFPDFDARTSENIVYFDNISFGSAGGGGGGATVTVPVDFEDAGGPYTFNDFGGGVATVIDNVQPTGNASAKVGQMQKFAGDVFGGSTLTLDAAVDFTAGEVFTMKVFSQKVSALTFKLEGLNVEEVVNTTGAGWETLSFDFTGRTTGAAVMGITLIFDNGTAGDALNDPTNWTFLFDDIELTAGGGGGGGGGAAADIDFETGATGAAFTWNVFENVDNPALVIGANPDATGINTSTTVAQFTARQAGQPFAGVITNDLPTFTLDATNSVVKIMVYKSVISDVGIKFENGIGGSTGDIKVANTLINTWEELTFDFSAVIGDPNNTDITGFIVFPDFDARASENIVYFDNISFGSAGGGGGGGGSASASTDFEGPAGNFVFTDFNGGQASVVANPQQNGINTSANVGQMIKFEGDTFGGSTFALGGTLDIPVDSIFTMKVWSPRPVNVLFKLEGGPVGELEVAHGGTGWELLTFDFTGVAFGDGTNAITLIFDNGIAGEASTDPGNWTFYFDDINLVAGGGGGGGGGAAADIDFETGATGAAFTWNVFENVDNPALVIGANPDATGINTSTTVAQFTARQAGQPFAGVITNDLPTFTLDATNSVVKIMVYKSVISDVGIKFENGIGGSTGDIKVANTLINTWEELTFDFSAVIGDPNNTDITGFIVFPDFDARTSENIVYFDNISFGSAGGGGGGATVTVPVDFEDAGGPYTFNDFGGGVATVIDNVQPTGNASAKVGQMQKFAGDVFGGSTLTLDAAVDFTAGEVFTMKVFSQKVSALTFKLEGLNVEEVVNTTGAGWETLSFDFTGRTTGAAVMGITLIFDNGTAGDALNDPTNWTFLFDDIELTAGGGGGGGGGAAADIDFETGATGAAFTWNVFENVDNPALVIGANPDATGINTSTTVAQFTARQAGQPFAGVITNDLPTFTLDATNSVVKIMVYKSVISDVGIKFENGIGGSTGDIKVANTLINTWEELTFDFSAVIGDPNNTDITGFIVFPDFDARTSENIVYFDNISFGSAGGGGGGATGELIPNGDFENGVLIDPPWKTDPLGGTVAISSVQSLSGTFSANLHADVDANGGAASFPILKVERVGEGSLGSGPLTVTVSFDLFGSSTSSGLMVAEFFSEHGGVNTGAANQVILSAGGGSVPTSTWSHYSFPVTTHADIGGGLSLLFKADCGAQAGCVMDVFIDNVSITVP